MEDPASPAAQPGGPVLDAALGAAPGKPLSEAARRALEEAAARRAAIDAAAERARAGETRDGPSGLEPTRYGDWERKGMAIDF